MTAMLGVLPVVVIASCERRSASARNVIKAGQARLKQSGLESCGENPLEPAVLQSCLPTALRSGAFHGLQHAGKCMFAFCQLLFHLPV